MALRVPPLVGADPALHDPPRAHQQFGITRIWRVRRSDTFLLKTLEGFKIMQVVTPAGVGVIHISLQPVARSKQKHHHTGFFSVMVSSVIDTFSSAKYAVIRHPA